jgi:zinc/manganese transport system substrate-binding protein
MKALPWPWRSWRTRRPRLAAATAALASAAALAGCAATGTISHKPGTVVAIGAENEYANVLAQIGGRYVATAGIMNNPNTDPHTFEASPQVAREVAGAGLVVQNGVGYDGFMTQIENAAPNSGRAVIDVQHLLGLPDTTANPHLWYDPTTMPRVARAIGADLSRLQPAHAAYFRANVTRFDASLRPWDRAIATLRARFPHAAVATTEPVADYLLQAAGLDIRTPWTFQADIMNGVDPSPQGAAIERALFTDHQVRVFVYNEQVTDSLTDSLVTLAHQARIPVVAVYETMPTPGYDYQSWMLAETQALTRALATGQSTTRL